MVGTVQSSTSLGELARGRSASLLVGREEEKRRLLRALDAEGPLLLFVHGIAGIGKSTLLSAFAQEARSAGARGYLLKDLAPDALCDAIRDVAAGQTVWRGGAGPELSRVAESSALGHRP